MRTKILVAALFTIGAALTSYAQTDAVHNTFEAETTVVDAGKSIYADVENDLYFVDFESLSVNLDNIVVKDERGEVVLQKKVFDLPVDTIYELDLSTYTEGKYKIELHSYTGTIRKEIVLK